MSVDISVSITEDIVDIIATPTVNIVNVTNSASIDPSLYDLSEFTNTSPNPFVRTSGLSSYVPTSRTISTTSPLSGGGDLSVNRTLSISQANGTTNGFLSSSDWTMFNNKQNALGYTPVPETRTLTINGTTQDLSADRTFTISTGITIGTTAITSGTVGRVLFEGTGNVVQQSSSLFWDSTNNRLGIGTSSPAGNIDINANFATTGYPLIVKNTGYFNAFFQGTSANNQASFYLENDRGSTLSYGGFAIGGSTSTLGNIFGLTRPDRLFMFADGTNNVGYAIGTLQNVPLQFGTNNTIRATIFGNGNIGINTTTDAGFRLDVNGTARVSETITSNLSSANWDLGTYNILDLQRNGSSRATLKSNGTFSWTSGTDLTINSGGGTARTVLSSVNSEILAVANQAGIDYNARFSQRAGKIALRVLGISGTTQNLFEVLTGASVNAFNIFSSGNVGINTTTDAGFRLDVNGTARVSNNGVVNVATFTGSDGSTIIDRYGNFYSQGLNATSGINGTGVVGLRINKTDGNGKDWRFEQNRNLTDGSLELGVSPWTNNILTLRSTGVIGINTNAPNASAQLEVASTTRGFLPPRMTTTQKNAIATPATGLMVYDTTLNLISVYNGTTWITL